MKLWFFTAVLLFTFAFSIDALAQMPGGSMGQGGMNSTQGQMMRNMPPSQGRASQTESLIEDPPHGGIVKSAGRFYIEVIVDWMKKEDKMTVFFLNSAGKSVPVDKVNGYVQVIQKDGEIVKLELQPLGEDRFIAQIDEDLMNCVISFEKKGKTFSAPFQADMDRKSRK